jgi:hypothetical protein
LWRRPFWYLQRLSQNFSFWENYPGFKIMTRKKASFNDGTRGSRGSASAMPHNGSLPAAWVHRFLQSKNRKLKNGKRGRNPWSFAKQNSARPNWPAWRPAAWVRRFLQSKNLKLKNGTEAIF